MNHLKNMLFLFCLGISLSLAAQDHQGPKRHIEKIIETSANFSQYYMDADYEGIANTYSKDAKILPPGEDIITGRAAIKERWILPEGVKIVHHKATSTELKIIGKYAYDMGYYEGKTLKKDGEEISWKGKYLIVWKREGKDWKMYMDIWNRI